MTNKEISIYEGEYFVFSVNSPLFRSIYGEKTPYESCLLFQKYNGKLVPSCKNTEEWVNYDIDEPSKLSDTLEEIINKKIKSLYTTSLYHYPENKLWGLQSVYPPKGLDSHINHIISSRIYFEASQYARDEFSKKSIKIKKVIIDPKYF